MLVRLGETETPEQVVVLDGAVGAGDALAEAVGLELVDVEGLAEAVGLAELVGLADAVGLGDAVGLENGVTWQLGVRFAPPLQEPKA